MLDNDQSTESTALAASTNATSHASERAPKPQPSGRNRASASRRTVSPTPRQGSAAKPTINATSKQDRVVAMLQRKDGISIAAIMKATGWQQHSGRGFFAGVVRKKLKLNLSSQEIGGKRIYRIAPGKAVTRKRSR